MKNCVRRAISKVLKENEFVAFCRKLKSNNLKIVFTNGCFDILHLGHLRYLEEAKMMGDVLVVAVNSDSSVREIKGSFRPIMPESARAELVAGLYCVDSVTIFSSPTPLHLITQIRPDVLVKGADWSPDAIVGKDFVESYGGKVATIPFVEGFSTSNIIEKILRFKKDTK